MHDCVPNIGPRQRARRLAFGLVALAFAAVLALLLVAAPIVLRTLLFLPLLGAATGVFQYLDRT